MFVELSLIVSGQAGLSDLCGCQVHLNAVSIDDGEVGEGENYHYE